MLLANWVHVRGDDWRERVARWLPAQGVDALVVQREVLDPAEYVAMWLRDSGEGGDVVGVRRVVAGLGGGSGGRRGDGVRADPAYGLRRAVGADRLASPGRAAARPHLTAWLDRRAWLAGCDDDGLLAARLCVAPDVVQEQIGQPGADDPEHVVLRRAGGLRPAVRVDTATAALVGASEGTLTVAALVAAVASVLGDGPRALSARLLGEVRDLVDQGLLRAFLTAGGTAGGARGAGCAE